LMSPPTALATSASAGASRSVGMNSWDQRCMIASIHNSLSRMQECEGKRTWLHPLPGIGLQWGRSHAAAAASFKSALAPATKI
jgi:hypothetical protein